MYAFFNLCIGVFCSWNLKTENAAATTVCAKGGIILNQMKSIIQIVVKS